MSRESVRKSKRSGINKCDVTGEVAPLVQHHIHGRDINNYNADWNIAWVTATVHDLIHRGDIVIEGWVTTMNGRALCWHKRGEDSITGNNSDTHLFGDGLKRA